MGINSFQNYYAMFMKYYNDSLKYAIRMTKSYMNT
jgi:hypothetical protein